MTTAANAETVDAAATVPSGRRSGKSLARSAAVVASIRIIDTGLSFLVSLLLASRFGTSGALDAFFLARRTTVGFADTIRKLVSQIIMPSVIAKIDSGEHLSVHGLSRRVYVFLGLFIALTLAGTLVPSMLVSAFAPGFSDERHDLTAQMMQIMMPLLPLAVIGSLLVAVLQANHKYWLSEGTNIVQRALLVFVLAVFIPPLGIVAGAWTMLGAGIAGTAILAVGAWPILRRRPAAAGKADVQVAQSQQMVGGGIAAAIVLNVYFQATALLDFAYASTVPEGGIAALEYGARLVSLIPGLLMSSLYTVLQPELIRAMQAEDPNEVSAGLARYQRIAFFAQLPVSIGMMLGATFMVTILFGRGAFDATSIALASGTCAGYAAASIFLAPMSATTSAIYADPRAPCLGDLVVIAVGGIAIRVTMLALAAPVWGAVGIAWAAAAATLVTFVLAQFVAARRFRQFEITGQLTDFARSAFCGGVAALAGYAVLLAFIPETTFMRLVSLVLIGAAVVLAYVGMAMMLHVPELAPVREIISRKLKRVRK